MNFDEFKRSRPIAHLAARRDELLTALKHGHVPAWAREAVVAALVQAIDAYEGRANGTRRGTEAYSKERRAYVKQFVRALPVGHHSTVAAIRKRMRVAGGPVSDHRTIQRVLDEMSNPVPANSMPGVSFTASST